jgi:putative ABC transport system permease protein
MNTTLQPIAYIDLALAFIPVIIVIVILYKWSLGAGYAIYALSRMLAQLLIIGYFLNYIFAEQEAWPVIVILNIMLAFSSWIALGCVANIRKRLYWKALFAIILGGVSTLMLVTQGVLHLQPWHLPQYIIPLAGMIFANNMNSVSLAAERLNAEINRSEPYQKAKNIAFNASLIPIINSLFAVGLVSLPGMMTGQILSGISPFVAARYQIMVMCMLFGAAGISSACFLTLVKKEFSECKSEHEG